MLRYFLLTLEDSSEFFLLYIGGWFSSIDTSSLSLSKNSSNDAVLRRPKLVEPLADFKAALIYLLLSRLTNPKNKIIHFLKYYVFMEVRCDAKKVHMKKKYFYKKIHNFYPIITKLFQNEVLMRTSFWLSFIMIR